MGTDLKSSVLAFFTSRMAEHSKVESYNRLPIEEEYIFELVRRDGLPTMRVHVSDAYDYGSVDYLSRPRQLWRGDFILIARPEARFDHALIEEARNDGIGIGMIGKLMGALNFKEPCKYIPKDERPSRA
jgi:hypothetical protein